CSRLLLYKPQDSKLFHFRPRGGQLLPFRRLFHFRRHHYQLLHFKSQDSKPLHFRPQHCQLLHFKPQDSKRFHFKPRNRQLLPLSRLLRFRRRHYQLLHSNLLLIPHHHKQHPINVLNVSLHIIGLSME
ncbi:hypothetical protein A4A49_66061, partial [Nicotiana attenuata]